MLKTNKLIFVSFVYFSRGKLISISLKPDLFSCSVYHCNFFGRRDTSKFCHSFEERIVPKFYKKSCVPTSLFFPLRGRTENITLVAYGNLTQCNVKGMMTTCYSCRKKGTRRNHSQFNMRKKDLLLYSKHQAFRNNYSQTITCCNCGTLTYKELPVWK